jgi:hypothetical protein
VEADRIRNGGCNIEHATAQRGAGGGDGMKRVLPSPVNWQDQTRMSKCMIANNLKINENKRPS